MSKRKITENTLGGESPIYYDRKGNWSKDPKDLLSDRPREVNPEALFDFFLYRTEVPPQSIYAGISSLFPGEELWEIDGKLVTLNPMYAKLADIREKGGQTVPELVDALDKFLEKSIREGTRNAKHVAITLSGGVDSSLLATYLPKDTVCVTWGGWGDAGTDVTYSKKIASALGLTKQIVVPFEFEKDEALYREAVRKSPTPFMYTLGVSFLRMSQQLKEEFHGEPYSLVVGQNADTVAGAYKTTIATYYLSRLARFTKYFPFSEKFLNAHRRYVMLTSPNPFKGFAFHHSTGLYPSPWLNIPESYFDRKLEQFESQIGRKYGRFNDSVLMEELMVEGRRAQFAQHVLTKMNGGETIAPFYDKNVVELMMTVPPRIRRMNNFGKVIIRELAIKRGVPEDVVMLKEKKGLSYNHRAFFDAGKHLVIWDALEADPILNAHIDIKAVRSVHERNYFMMDLLRSLHEFFNINEFIRK